MMFQLFSPSFENLIVKAFVTWPFSIRKADLERHTPRNFTEHSCHYHFFYQELEQSRSIWAKSTDCGYFCYDLFPCLVSLVDANNLLVRAEAMQQKTCLWPCG